MREVYDESKLRAGMEKALEKRPVAREAIDEAVSRITHKVRIIGDREVPSRVIGEFVMEELRQLDEVAYVRFASVYRHFQDVEAFHEEIQRLRAQRHGLRAGCPGCQAGTQAGEGEPTGTSCLCCRPMHRRPRDWAKVICKRRQGPTVWVRKMV